MRQSSSYISDIEPSDRHYYLISSGNAKQYLKIGLIYVLKSTKSSSDVPSLAFKIFNNSFLEID